MSFRRFIGLSLGERVPDAKTIRLFSDTLTQNGIIRELFAQFNGMLASKGIITHTGTIVDATFVDAPRQRNSRDENDRIKNGETPKEWEENPNKLAQKDTDARRTKKNDETHYGYKNLSGDRDRPHRGIGLRRSRDPFKSPTRFCGIVTRFRDGKLAFLKVDIAPFERHHLTEASGANSYTMTKK